MLPRFTWRNFARSIIADTTRSSQTKRPRDGLTEVDAREFVLLCDFLRAEVLLDRDRVVRSALDRGLCITTT